jgi:3-hydroxyisobutyrate dehydrogenase
MGTIAPAFSAELAETVRECGGFFVEAPVSGSRHPAEEGTLVSMVAGSPDVVNRILPLLAPMCSHVVACGEVPSALTMKLAANVFLISVVTGLAESFHFAMRHGADLALLRDILDGGQMSSPISRLKTAKLVSQDLAPQAAISDVLMNAELIVAAAREAGIASPLLDVSRDLYAEAVELGDGAIDMVGVIQAITARTNASPVNHQ